MRELRHRLREYLARVEAGERFEVTLFGRPVAQLRPVGTGRPTLAQLVDDGLVTPALNPDTLALPPAVLPIGDLHATDALIQERRTDSR